MHIVITKFSRVNKIYNCLQVYIIYFWHRLSWNYYIWHVLWHRHWRITSYFKNNYLSNGGLLCNFTFKFWNTFSYGRTFYTQASAFSRNYSMVLAESGTSQDFDFEDDDDDEEDDVTVVNHGKLFTYFIMWYKNSVCSAVQVYDLRFRLDIIFDYGFCLHCTLHYSFSIKEKKCISSGGKEGRRSVDSQDSRGTPEAEDKETAIPPSGSYGDLARYTRTGMSVLSVGSFTPHVNIWLPRTVDIFLVSLDVIKVPLPFHYTLNNINVTNGILIIFLT